MCLLMWQLYAIIIQFLAYKWMPHNFLENKFRANIHWELCALLIFVSPFFPNLWCLSIQANKAQLQKSLSEMRYSYLAHDARMDRLDGDVLSVEVEAVHQALGGPDELIALAAVWPQSKLSLQIHNYDTGGINRENQSLSSCPINPLITLLSLLLFTILLSLLIQIWASHD